MPLPVSRRPAFTLIEILAALAIVAILAGMVMALSGLVSNQRRSARARGEIQLLAAKLEEFKTRYGEYPMPNSSSEADCEKALFYALTGQWYYKGNPSTGVRQWDTHLQGASSDQIHPFIETGRIGTDAAWTTGSTAAPTKFIDPWGNAYRYRYGVENAATGKPNTDWDRPGFLLISAGANFSKSTNEMDAAAPLPDTDFFAASEATTGVVPSTYFDDQYRADNLTNFGPK